jgi:hypothetical protein
MTVNMAAAWSRSATTSISLPAGRQDRAKTSHSARIGSWLAVMNAASGRTRVPPLAGCCGPAPDGRRGGGRAVRPEGADRSEPASGGTRVVRLAAFITANHEPILAEWEVFARSCRPAGSEMDVVALRDHAAAMLTVIAADLNTPQGGAAQAAKGQGPRARRPRRPHDGG